MACRHCTIDPEGKCIRDKCKVCCECQRPLKAPAEPKSDGKGNVVMFPSANRPEDSIGFISEQSAKGDLQGVCVITTSADGSIEYRAFGKLKRRDLVFACERISYLSVAQEDD